MIHKTTQLGTLKKKKNQIKENLIPFLSLARYFNDTQPAGESAKQAMPIGSTQSGTPSGTQCSEPTPRNSLFWAALRRAALHTCMQSCTHAAKITPWRATVLTACELLRIRSLWRAAGTILCVDMCGCACAMRRGGRCCTAWLHVRGERCSVHMETFSAAASAPGSGPMCKLAAFILAHQAGQPPTAVI